MEHGIELPAEGRPLEIGKGRIMREGSTVALLSLGTRLGECMKAADQLAALGLSATVADARFAKPIDTDLIRRLATNHEVLVTIEEGQLVCGVGAEIAFQVRERVGAVKVARVGALPAPVPGMIFAGYPKNAMLALLAFMNDVSSCVYAPM